MAQRSISSFFFKGAASVGAGAPATAVAADPTSPPAVANDAETADAPEIETRKRKRESGDEGTARDETPGTGTPGRSDDHGVSATGDSVSPETRAEILAVTAERDPRRRDAMRERLGENAVGSSESKRREVRERFKWLDAKHVVDDKGRHPSHEDYDSNTVRVPSHLKLSASQKQYWDVKSKFRDVVLFFKVGKFYELYEDDAEIGCAALDWKMTVSGVGHCRQVGCPESGVDAAIAELVRRGHKVGRIEQMETAAEAKARTGSKTAVIRRELLEVTSPATAVDGDLLPHGKGGKGGSSRGGQSGVRPAHLMAIAEGIAERGDGNAKASATVGFAFLDAAAGTLRCGSFADDAGSVSCGAQSHIALSTLLTQTSPAEVLVRRGDGGRTEARVRAALANGDPSAAPRVTSVASDADEGGPEGFFFPARARDADAALARFFLRDEKNTDARTTQSDKSDKSVLAFVATQPAETRCAVAALAAHLTRLRCAAPLLAAEAATHAVYAPGETARLDGPTVRHLELLCGPDGTLQGSVLGELDTCATPAGSRTLRRWLAAPLTSPERVAERQDAVAFFGGFADDFGSAERTDERDNENVGEVGADNCGRLRRALRRVPDLERCVGRARAASAAKTADPRALPEPLAEKRHKRRVAALAAAVAAADAVVGALRDIADIADFQARAPALVKASVRAAHPETLGGGASDALEEARAALDWGSAGDDAGSAKTASRTAAAAAPALKSTRAPETRARLEASPEASMDVLAACEREVDALLERFLEHAPCWGALATAAARLDALAALAAFGANAAGPTCRPAFVRRAEDAAPTFHARALWNPCAVESLHSAGSSRARTGVVGGSGVVPNDLDLGGFDASGSGTPLPPAVLLTGPNMGGKSTLLRAACVAVVLAQVGAPVPCASLTLSPADVVFTRLGGASDRLDAGESTFLVECAEAASILRGASRDSFVVLDELGRGTSTFDGYAVAHAALHALVVRTKCRLLFATHYHALSRAFGATPAVALRHMAARVGAEHLGDRSIAFLYALRPGACPKSYGTNVAALAGVPESVLVRATQASAAMERKLAGAFAIGSEDSGERDARALRRALAARDPEALGEAWASLR